MLVTRLTTVVTFCAILGTASSALAQTAGAGQLPQARIEIAGEYGGHYWIVETAADGSRRGGWVSKQTPLDRIDRSMLQPIGPLRTQQPTAAVLPAPSPSLAAEDLDDRLARIEQAIATLTAPNATLPATPIASAPARDVEPRAQRSLTARHYSQEREGFWFNGGMGLGLAGCLSCGGRDAGLSGGLALGGKVSERVLLGVGTTGWYRSYGVGLSLSGGTTDARIRFYPSAGSGFFITGGLGLGHISVSAGSLGTASELGLGTVFGLGWDVRIARNVSLTPFYNGFAVATSNADGHVDQFGIGITVH